ncbi:MAG: lactate utilization protein B [Syntrophobacteraceae bacterium]|nr:lactate utilization protein B [Syntrophobacteraceae bacterium]
MMKASHNFRKASAAAVADEVLGAAVEKTATLLFSGRASAAARYPGFEELRDWGRSRKMEVSGDLWRFARRFADRLEAAGGVAHYARDAREAVEIVEGIARRLGAVSAVKSKSMTAEEVSLNEALLKAGVAVTETDLGEFIIQLAGEKPSHIVAPAIHKNREQVADLFHKALGSPPGLDVGGLVQVARKTLRERFLAADIGITGANFAVSETGSIAIVTNEGNGRLTTALPPVQIALVGIDKIIPKLYDLTGILTLLTRSATGQVVSSYVTVITGPRREGEEEGPRELHVVLLDNGRSSLAAGQFREMLHCLHCGACLNSCPVYRAVGGHAYESVYPGPMGDVLSPLLWGLDAYADLPDACTLCGRCAEVCPMRIPLPEFHRRLRVLRTDLKGKKAAWKALVPAILAGHPMLYRAGLKGMRRLLSSGPGLSGLLKAGPAKAWSLCREAPRPGEGPDFRSWWEQRQKGPKGDTDEQG